MTRRIQEVLTEGIAALRSAGVPDPARDARLLMADALGLPADRLTLHLHDPWPGSGMHQWFEHVAARSARQPVSQILGRRAFYGRMFCVTSDVLDPRPETEILVETALDAPAKRILDIGTGSGCILLTLLAEWSEASGIGTDCSQAALDVARTNAQTLGLEDRASWQSTHWATDVAGTFDLVVSNPPYIDQAELDHLEPEVTRWEPPMALSPGLDGTSSYQDLVPQAERVLTPRGRLILEIGPTQADAVSEILRSASFTDIQAHTDLDGRNRVIAARKPL
ncbi:MAG: peptide chain release factor N(5)-glutamine methyltransferase [Pseudomonadota bacterium]